jgi:hypothetical protein
VVDRSSKTVTCLPWHGSVISLNMNKVETILHCVEWVSQGQFSMAQCEGSYENMGEPGSRCVKYGSV